jgi:predicted TIM-barrel fold metal-dependent hydrolase
MTSSQAAGRGLRAVWTGPVVDADVHATVPSIEALRPYLQPVWRQYIDERGFKAPPNDQVYPAAAASSARGEWRPPDGRVPASTVEMLRQDILDPSDVEIAVVNCSYTIDQGHPDFAVALARAVNDWLIAEWLDEEPRLRASIVVPGRDPAAMLAEIDRVADHPGFVQVLLPVRSGRAYGNRTWHPLLKGIAERGLVAGLHRGGTNDGAAPTPSGWPSWHIEEYVAEQQVYEAQIMSLIAEGVFSVAPSLRVSVLETGFAWVPTWGWRLDKDWKGMRREIPWVKREPFAYLREHFRFSTAPLDAGPSDEMADVVRWLGSEDMLMFATDYPHHHDDDIVSFLDVLTPSMQINVMAASAKEWYRL